MPDHDIGRDAAPGDARTLGLLLVPGFALMSYASVIEPYRAANRLAGRSLYRWIHISIDGAPTLASNGAMILADQAVGDPVACDTLFVIAGGDPAEFDGQPTLAWLRRMARTGCDIAGISAGPYFLARAGLLAGHRATIHWEHRDAFIEAFPLITLEPGLYVIDRRRLTCAGGMAAMDLALALIEREHGAALAAAVSDWFIRSAPRAADGPQRLGLRDRTGVANDRVLKVLAHMERSIEEPASLAALAQSAGVTPRHLERLFVQTLGETVRGRYVRIRLALAQRLLRTTGQTATQIAFACGFRSFSHFSRRYRQQHGQPPSKERHPPEPSGPLVRPPASGHAPAAKNVQAGAGS